MARFDWVWGGRGKGDGGQQRGCDDQGRDGFIGKLAVA